MSRLDLHLHTTHSDGSHTPSEVIGLAHQAGVTALAITDHDIMTGVAEAITAAEPCGIEVIPGVEVSSISGRSELHILGYFLDWHDSVLNERFKALRDSRHRRNPQIIERLQSLGIDITYEEVRALAGSDSVGRPHIARALMNDPLFLLADEPTGNLDPVTSLDIVRLLASINANGTTVLMATHDNVIVDEFRRRVIELADGKVMRDEAQGSYVPRPDVPARPVPTELDENDLWTPPETWADDVVRGED